MTSSTSNASSEPASSSSKPSKGESCLGNLNHFEGAEWNAIAYMNNLRFWHGDTVRAKVDDVLRAFKAGIKYPRGLVEEKFVDWVAIYDKKRSADFPEWDDPCVSWLKNIPNDSFEDVGSDTYETGWLSITLYRAWDGLVRTNLYNTYVKTERRNALDTLIRIAFETRLKACQFYRAERELYLPSKPYTVIADGITVIRLPEDWYKSLDWQYNYIFTSIGYQVDSMITFVVEYGKTASTAGRRLALALCSAQHSRRALGFGDGRLYGATLVNMIFTIYSSVWEDDKVVVLRTSTNFDVKTFKGFVDCYIFLCKLADRVAADAQRFFSQAETEEGKQKLQRAQRDAINKPWRLLDKPPGRKRPMEDLHYDSNPIPPGGLGSLLIERNLVALDKATGSEMEHDVPAKRIRSWTEETLVAGNNPDELPLSPGCVG